MDAGKVNRRQAGIIHAKLVEPSRYLWCLRNRMVEVGFSLDDPLFRKVYHAQMAMHDLVEELHSKAHMEIYGGKPK
jgi:hypothetical protein